MAASVTQRELLTLIRDFATEKSQGERRVADLKKRIEELRSALDATNVDLEEAKRRKENAEQELKGYEVELTMNESSIQAQEARVTLIQNEISRIGTEVEAIKSEERICRDEFIRLMFAFNNLTRKHQEEMASFFCEDANTESSAAGGEKVDNMLVDIDEAANKIDIEVELKKLNDKITLIISQTHQVEQERQENQNNQKKFQQVFANLEKKVSLIKAVVKETKELQELTKQTAKLEETCSAFGEELQKRCICPSCHQDNVGELAGPFEGSQGS